MGDKAAKILANDAMPSGTKPGVEILLDILSNVLFNAEFLHGLGRNFDSLLLHLLGLAVRLFW